jgi:hypothetical protein
MYQQPVIPLTVPSAPKLELKVGRLGHTDTPFFGLMLVPSFVCLSVCLTHRFVLFLFPFVLSQ